MKKAILRTLAYADIFDYPLNEREIFRFLISKFPIPSSKFRKKFATSSSEIFKKDGYFFLKGRQRIVALRRQRWRWSNSKLKIARRTARWLRLIPTVKMVAVTGALAMANADGDDDIDLLIVTARDRLWLTRFLTVVLVELVAQRRRPDQTAVKDKICLNMFLDETHLAVPKKEQDLYSAHEVCQLLPFWDRNGTYQKFIAQNQWVKKYLANWRP